MNSWDKYKSLGLADILWPGIIACISGLALDAGAPGPPAIAPEVLLCATAPDLFPPAAVLAR